MLQIMLCGASDTQNLAKSFAEVTSELGGEAWHYLDGNLRYLNSASANWETNSRRTVAAADLCVFVILERYGEITWNTELREALTSGKPFMILCLDSTYREYIALTRNIPDHAIPDEGKRLLVRRLTALESEFNLTVATFDYATFKDVYRREASKLFDEALQLLTLRFQRQALVGLLGDPSKLSAKDLHAAEVLACDELEDKNPRKLAISALMARSAASPDTVQALLNSQEQGIQRMAVHGLARLYVERPAEPSFLEDCVTLVNQSDDTGLARRLIPSLFEIGAPEAIYALDSLDVDEVGTRRRLAQAIEFHEHAIVSPQVKAEAVALLQKCLTSPKVTGWQARCRALINRLGDKPD